MPVVSSLHKDVVWPSMELIGLQYPITAFGRWDRPAVQPLSCPVSIVIFHGKTKIFLSWSVQTGAAIASVRRGDWWSGWCGSWWIRKKKGSASQVIIASVAFLTLVIKKEEITEWCETKSKQRQLLDAQEAEGAAHNLKEIKTLQEGEGAAEEVKEIKKLQEGEGAADDMKEIKTWQEGESAADDDLKEIKMLQEEEGAADDLKEIKTWWLGEGARDEVKEITSLQEAEGEQWLIIKEIKTWCLTTSKQPMIAFCFEEWELEGEGAEDDQWLHV